MSAVGWSLPECVVTNDHYWRGNSVCSACGTRLRCGCGQYVREDRLSEHEPLCPQLLKMEREHPEWFTDDGSPYDAEAGLGVPS